MNDYECRYFWHDSLLDKVNAGLKKLEEINNTKFERQ